MNTYSQKRNTLPMLTAFVAVFTGGAMASMKKSYRERIVREDSAQGVCPERVLAESDIAPLPDPVRRWIARSGAVGKPVPCSMRMRFKARMWRAPDAKPFALEAWQTSFLREPVRLFYMEARMLGLPVRGLHVYDRGRASMDVRLAGIVPVARASGDTMDVSETVTFLNDIVLFAPFLLPDPRLRWTEIDARTVDVHLSMGGRSVSARVFFDDSGDVADFRSEDRSELQPDGSMKRLPWSTPVVGYREIDGRRVPAGARTIYHRPEGPFTYGEFELVDVGYDPSRI